MRNQRLQIFMEIRITEVALVHYTRLYRRFLAEGKDFVNNLETHFVFSHKVSIPQFHP